MNYISKVCFYSCLYIILIATGLYAETSQRQSVQNYFEHYPSAWTKIVPNAETVVVANSEKHNIRVQIRTHKEQIVREVNGKKTSHLSNRCSDNCINVTVNGKQILVPSSVFCDIGELSSAKIFLEQKKSVLILNAGGDGMYGYVVKIEFDKKRITRKSVYADSSLGSDVLLEDTTYHTVVYQ